MHSEHEHYYFCRFFFACIYNSGEFKTKHLKYTKFEILVPEATALRNKIAATIDFIVDVFGWLTKNRLTQKLFPFLLSHLTLSRKVWQLVGITTIT